MLGAGEGVSDRRWGRRTRGCGAVCATRSLRSTWARAQSLTYTYRPPSCLRANVAVFTTDQTISSAAIQMQTQCTVVVEVLPVALLRVAWPAVGSSWPLERPAAWRAAAVVAVVAVGQPVAEASFSC